MSNHAQQAKTILEALYPAVVAAWGMDRVFLGDPANRQTKAPYAVISFASLAQDFSGQAASLSQTNGTHTFSIVGRWAFPSDAADRLSFEKLDRLSELLTQLQFGPLFAGGMLPLVSSAVFEDLTDSPTDAVYKLTATFTVVSRAPHH